MPPVAGALLDTALVASCLRGACGSAIPLISDNDDFSKSHCTGPVRFLHAASSWSAFAHSLGG